MWGGVKSSWKSLMRYFWWESFFCFFCKNLPNLWERVVQLQPELFDPYQISCTNITFCNVLLCNYSKSLYWLFCFCSITDTAQIWVHIYVRPDMCRVGCYLVQFDFQMCSWPVDTTIGWTVIFGNLINCLMVCGNMSFNRYLWGSEAFGGCRCSCIQVLAGSPGLGHHC